jgi:simple sugar transport system ATP-binding protein
MRIKVLPLELVLEMQDICKTFYGDGVEVKANDHVNFDLIKGEIHAVLGENGAGKTTLVASLFHKPDKGIIKINGKPVEIKNPLAAFKFGLAIARQDLSKTLIERHTIAENILSMSQGFFISPKTVSEKIKKLLKEYDLGDLNPNTKVGRLSGGEKQRVEILKALITNPEIIILDEPTAMLTPQEINNLFKLLQSLRQKGKSIIIITHHLDEAVNFSDRITILRNGKLVEVIDTQKMKESWKSEDERIRHLANLMVGHEVSYILAKNTVNQGSTILETKNLFVNNDLGDNIVKNVSLSINEGQILGLAGISGNGQSELIESIFKWRKIESGEIFIRGKPFTNASISEIRKQGVAYVPEDRRKALIPDLSVRENLMLNLYNDFPSLFINSKHIIIQTDLMVEKYKIKAPNSLVPVRTLSGGNKQKVVIAREFSISPPENQSLILIVENPTFGLDIATTLFVREELLEMRSKGAAILLVSSDLTEILTLSDKIAVIYKGEIVGIVDSKEANRENIGLLMGGRTKVRDVNE